MNVLTSEQWTSWFDIIMDQETLKVKGYIVNYPKFVKNITSWQLRNRRWNMFYFNLTYEILYVTHTLSIYIFLVSPGTAIFEGWRYCIPLYFVELPTVISTNFLHRVGLPYTSDQSTFVKPKVNVLKDIQILTQNDLCPTRSWRHVNSCLIIMGYSFWILLGKYHHISTWLLSSVNPPGYFWRNSHQSF